jgi:hypothetical protein
MSFSERPARKTSIAEVAGYAVLAAVAASFLALHVLAGNIELPGNRHVSASAEAVKLSGD